MRRIIFLATLLLSLSVAPAYASGRKLQSVGYWPAWEHAPVSSIPWRALTQLIVFSDTTTSRAPFLDVHNHGMTTRMQKRLIRVVHRHGDIALLAIGGSDDQTWSTACNASDRRKFIHTVIGQMNKYRYDGVDLDVEQGRWIVTSAFRACVRSFRRAFAGTRTSAGKTPVLSLDSDPSWEASETAPVARYLSQINLMDYGSTCARRCSDVRNAIARYTSRGVPASKLLEGIGLDPGMPEAADPSACGAVARYLSRNTKVRGVMEWSIQDDYTGRNRRYPCFRAMARYIK